MAKNITQNNVDFTVNTSENIGGFPHKRTNANSISNGKYSTTSKQALIDSGYESSGGGFSINAVDIDWNGAKPGIGEDLTTGITTTGELLSRIKEVYSPMFAN